MLVSIDSSGGVVIPMTLREKLDIRGVTDVEMRAVDGRIEITLPDASALVEQHGGLPVISTEQRMTPLTVEATRTAIERVRR